MTTEQSSVLDGTSLPTELPEKISANNPANNPARRRRKRRLIGTIGCSLGILAGVLGLVASRLGELWVGFDVFSQLTLQFAVVTAAFVIAAVLPRGRVLAGLVLTMLGFVAIGLWPVVAEQNSAEALPLLPGETGLSIVSFNTHSENNDWRAVVREMKRLNADVVSLVEINFRHQRGILAALKAEYPYQADCFEQEWCDFAILSKRPFTANHGKLMWRGPPYLAVHFGPANGGLTYFAVHTLRFPHSRSQRKQMIAFAELLNSTPGRKVVAGDFNSTPFSSILRNFTEATGLDRLTELPSWPAQLRLPQIAIDHVFVSPGIRVIRPERLGSPAGSDHYPVTVDLALPAG